MLGKGCRPPGPWWQRDFITYKIKPDSSTLYRPMLAVLVFRIIFTPRTNESYPICDDEERERDEETTTIMALQYNSYYWIPRIFMLSKHWSYSPIYLHHLVTRTQRKHRIKIQVMETAATAMREELEDIIVSLQKDQDVWYCRGTERDWPLTRPPVAELDRLNSDSGPNIIGCAVSSRIYLSSK